MATNNDVIAQLNIILRNELTAINQYFLHSRMYKHMGIHKLAEKEFLTGEFYFRRNLWDASIKYYEFVTNLYPESDFAPPALLGVYRANLEIGYDDLAEVARDLLLQRYPDSEAAAQIESERGSETDGERG